MRDLIAAVMTSPVCAVSGMRLKLVGLPISCTCRDDATNERL